jgi:hypothetical protein
MNAQAGTTLATTELALGAVLAEALPTSLLTADAPDRYTVAAVFTRRPTRSEVEAIHAGETRDLLSRAGYGTVELRVSDRRLEMANTNLDELQNGLAGVIATRLHDIGVQSAVEHDRFQAEMLEKTQRETDRAAVIALAAATVRFERPEVGSSNYVG